MLTALPLAKLQADVLRTPKAQPRNKVADPQKKNKQKKKNKAAIKLILTRIKALQLPNKRYQQLQPPASPERQQSSSPSSITSSTSVTATLTSVPNVISTSLTMRNKSTTVSTSDLASLIYSLFILDHLTFNKNIKLNFRKNIFCTFYYP